MRKHFDQKGFTILEVMIALGILSTGVVFLINTSGNNVRLAHRAQELDLATNLARIQMGHIEESFLTEGFDVFETEDSGDFSSYGYEKIQWHASFEKIEIPQFEDADDFGDTKNLNSDFSFIISEALGKAIRKVILTLSWQVGEQKEEMKIVSYFTNTASENIAALNILLFLDPS